MHHFDYINGALHAEHVPIAKIVAAVGTPVYVYSTATLVRHAQVFQAAFAQANPARTIMVCFAMKANSNRAVLATLAAQGIGADVVSEGEIRKALLAGIPAQQIVFSGVGKTDDELKFAVDAGIYQINVESEGELHRLAKIAAHMGKTMPIVLRVNPDVGAGGHEKITTGRDDNKFGVGFTEAKRLYTDAAQLPGVKIQGLAVHIGSQIFDLDPLAEAFTKLRGLAQELRDAGLPITHLDLGGGLGVPYEFDQTHPPEPAEYAQMVERVFAGFDVQLAFEPGRMIVGNAGVLITQVVDVKHRPNRRFIVVDAGMNDLMRPAMYEAFHHIQPVVQPVDGATLSAADVVGPVCESSDVFATDRMLPEAIEGDVYAILTAGAYGASMASSYNQRRLAPEVLVNGDEFATVRPRQSWDDLLGCDDMAAWQK